MRCGEALTLLDAESVRRLACPGCGLESYQNPVGASAGLVLRGEEVLLVQRGIEPFKGAWAIPAGYQDADESPPQAAEREILEETGVEVEAYMLLDLLWVPDDPRKPANVALFACRAIGGEASGADDAMDARWFPLDALPEELAFDNKAQVFDRLGPDGDLRAMLDLLGGNSSSGFVD
jgi:8-oxo-dGTP diphosphatase